MLLLLDESLQPADGSLRNRPPLALSTDNESATLNHLLRRSVSPSGAVAALLFTVPVGTSLGPR